VPGAGQLWGGIDQSKRVCFKNGWPGVHGKAKGSLGKDPEKKVSFLGREGRQGGGWAVGGRGG